MGFLKKLFAGRKAETLTGLPRGWTHICSVAYLLIAAAHKNSPGGTMRFWL
jgi:hypothetical protein